MLGLHRLSVGTSSVIEIDSVRTSSILVDLIGVHLLSEQVVNWYRFQNEISEV